MDGGNSELGVEVDGRRWHYRKDMPGSQVGCFQLFRATNRFRAECRLSKLAGGRLVPLQNPAAKDGCFATVDEAKARARAVAAGMEVRIAHVSEALTVTPWSVRDYADANRRSAQLPAPPAADAPVFEGAIS